MPLAIRRIGWIGLFACALALLTSCFGVGSTQTTEDGYRIPSEGQAEQAINEGMAAYNEACIVPDVLGRNESFPVTIVQPDTLQPPVRYQQLLALEGQNLLTNRPDTTSAGLVRRTFTLTEKGQEVANTIYEFQGRRTGLCYATPRVTSIDSIYAVPDRSPRPIAEVRYQWSLQEVQPWARDGKVKQLFPAIRSILRDAGTRTRSRRTLIEVQDNTWKDSRLTGNRAQEGPSPNRRPGS